jgi:hypothetical protein
MVCIGQIGAAIHPANPNIYESLAGRYVQANSERGILRRPTAAAWKRYSSSPTDRRDGCQTPAYHPDVITWMPARAVDDHQRRSGRGRRGFLKARMAASTSRRSSAACRTGHRPSQSRGDGCDPIASTRSSRPSRAAGCIDRMMQASRGRRRTAGWLIQRRFYTSRSAPGRPRGRRLWRRELQVTDGGKTFRACRRRTATTTTSGSARRTATS